ncbi:hypothetical protein SEVIR_4G069150v4 [Setaria viridis]
MRNEHEEIGTSMAIELYRQLALISTSASLSAISLASSLVNGGGSVHGLKPVKWLSMESIMHSRCRPRVGQTMDSLQISTTFFGTVGLYRSSLAYSVSRWSM